MMSIEDMLKLPLSMVEAETDVYFDGKVLPYIEALRHTPENIYVEAADCAWELKEKISNFDYYAVCGGSRALARVLMQATGIPAKKFITFNVDVNFRAYKLGSEVESYRPKVMKVRMESLGMDFSTKPSICIVDDRSISGIKAEDYLGWLKEIKEINRFGFAVLSIDKKNINSRIKDDKHFFYPEEALERDYEGLRLFFDNLSRLQSFLHHEHDEISFSDNVYGEGKLIVRHALEKLFNAAREKKT